MLRAIESQSCACNDDNDIAQKETTNKIIIFFILNSLICVGHNFKLTITKTYNSVTKI